MIFRRLIATALLFALVALTPSLASQSTLVMPTTGIVSGLTLVGSLNSAIDALVTCNSGASQPLNAATAPSAGQVWCDTATSGYLILKQYDGSSWNEIGRHDLTNHFWLESIGAGTASLASASTVDLGSVPQTFITVTGTASITSFGSSAKPGTVHILKFSGALTLTHNATSLILPNNGSNISVAVGGQAIALYLGGGNWTVVSYASADGSALNQSSNFNSSIFLNAPISPTALGATVNNWNPTGLSTANVIRFSCSTINVAISGITAPATDGKVLVLDNIGTTNSCSLSDEDGNSTAANRFTLTYAIAIHPLQSVTIKYDLTAARWRLIDPRMAQPISGSYRNLKMVNGGTPNNQMTVTADALTAEDATGLAVRLATVSVTPDVTVSGANGLDASTVTSSQWYSVWVIYNPTANTVAGLFSTNATSPTMPSGYTFKVRTGWARTDVSNHFFRIQQNGDLTHYVVTAATNTAALISLASGTAGSISVPTWVGVSVSNAVPPTATAIGVTLWTVMNGIAMVAPNTSYGRSPTTGGGGVATTNPPFMSMAASASPASGGSNITALMALETTSIDWASDTSTNSLWCYGWQDSL